jgi:hypothetical protein
MGSKFIWVQPNFRVKQICIYEVTLKDHVYFLLPDRALEITIITIKKLWGWFIFVPHFYSFSIDV